MGVYFSRRNGTRRGPPTATLNIGARGGGNFTNRWMGVFISRTGIAWRRSQSRSRLLCGPLDMAGTTAPSSSEEAYAGQLARSWESNGRNHARKTNKWGEIDTMPRARGQLWDNYGTTMGQLWDNYGTTYGTTHFLQVFVHFAIWERKSKFSFLETPNALELRKYKVLGLSHRLSHSCPIVVP